MDREGQYDSESEMNEHHEYLCLQAKKNYVQAVRRSRKSKSGSLKWIAYCSRLLDEATNDLQRLGIEPNYSLIVKELKGL